MHGISEAAPRILVKELNPLSIDADISLKCIYAKVRQRHLNREETKQQQNDED